MYPFQFSRRAALSLGILLIVSGCGRSKADPEVPPGRVDEPRRTVGVQGALATVDQGWSDADAEWFYSISQGSHLIPYDWLVFLEVPDGEESFVSSMSEFGYIPRGKSDHNPHGLPVGFAVDAGPERSWVGLTCAACHTRVIEYEGVSYLIDGGPGFGDIEGLLKSLVAALNATIVDDRKFDRFAASILGSPSSAVDREKLKEALKRVSQKQTAYNYRNLPSDPERRFGFGRVDAFGAILNEVTVRFLGIDQNHREANAPVTYPFLWDTPHHDFVQWNGSAPNARFGDLARNVGEVLGVFGDIEIPQHPPLAGYSSTVQIRNLLEVESKLKKLKSPEWPKAFPSLDTDAVARGRVHFARLCAQCHSLDFRRDDEDRRIIADMMDVGTDPLMSKNFRTRTALTGKLEGSRTNFLPLSPRFEAEASGESVLIHAVVGTILGGWKDPPRDALQDLKMREPVLKSDGPDRYKGRPLNGIWATAPYLHNGSVPTLRDLLKPSRDRPKTFWVGSRVFNPIDVGFDVGEHDPGSLFDTSLPGNSNSGHEYGTGVSQEDGGDGEKLDDQQVDDLLEFLKSL